MVDPSVSTGTCAVCINGGERSLVANLAAANNFKVGKPRMVHLPSPVFCWCSVFLFTLEACLDHMHMASYRLLTAYVCRVPALLLMCLPIAFCLLSGSTSAKVASAQACRLFVDWICPAFRWSTSTSQTTGPLWRRLVSFTAPASSSPCHLSPSWQQHSTVPHMTRSTA